MAYEEHRKEPLIGDPRYLHLLPPLSWDPRNTHNYTSYVECLSITLYVSARKLCEIPVVLPSPLEDPDRPVKRFPPGYLHRYFPPGKEPSVPAYNPERILTHTWKAITLVGALRARGWRGYSFSIESLKNCVRVLGTLRQEYLGEKTIEYARKRLDKWLLAKRYDTENGVWAWKLMWTGEKEYEGDVKYEFDKEVVAPQGREGKDEGGEGDKDREGDEDVEGDEDGEGDEDVEEDENGEGDEDSWSWGDEDNEGDEDSWGDEDNEGDEDSDTPLVKR